MSDSSVQGIFQSRFSGGILIRKFKDFDHSQTTGFDRNCKKSHTRGQKSNFCPKIGLFRKGYQITNLNFRAKNETLGN